MEQLVIQQVREKGRRMNATQACIALGLPRGYLHSRPWRVPGFGAGGLPPTLQEWETWLSRSESERRQEWDAMSVARRRKIRGIRNSEA